MSDPEKRIILQSIKAVSLTDFVSDPSPDCYVVHDYTLWRVLSVQVGPSGAEVCVARRDHAGEGKPLVLKLKEGSKTVPPISMVRVGP